MDEKKAPPSYWTMLISLAGLLVSLATLWMSTNKSNAEETRRLEQRLCRMEALSGVGECKR